MARARLHIICGNCGCNDAWEWKHIAKTEDDLETVWLFCNNCSTLHDVNDNAKKRDDTRAEVSGDGTASA